MRIYLPIFICAFFVLAAICQKGSGFQSSTENMIPNDTTKHKYTNALIHETSPYLLQHAHNPVNWYAWNDETLELAEKEQKLILVSIGYSACHWCHVMEHESFEDEEVAEYMNEHFVCIKVDREERPDIDQVYMNAVQLITGRGGWPLNCFALPDGKPFYGGTYFPKNQWLELLKGIVQEHKNNPEKLMDYASRLTRGIKESELVELQPEKADFDKEILPDMVKTWSTRFDNKEGGPNRAPKFPIPNNYEFLLAYGYLFKDHKVIDHVELTLEKMAYGGIYDQIGGGFARYSTDDLWKVPHFEKMLYDNAQMISLYAKAYRYNKNPLYREVVEETVKFVQREMTASNGACYSALDADSEGEEGKFYIWKKEELESILKSDFEFAKTYYNINAKGLWEHGNYILLRSRSDVAVAKKLEMSEKEVQRKVENIKRKLLEVRTERIRPGLDDKSLTSWNALMIKGYVDAYRALGNAGYLDAAIKTARFILDEQWYDDDRLNHSYKDGKSTINGYLEDYSFTIEAFLSLYEVTFDPGWLNHAKKLADHCIRHFYDEGSGMFFFTSDLDKALIARKMEVDDNVIPASNSSMAKALFQLGHYLGNDDFLKRSKQMLTNMAGEFSRYGSGYSNWAMLMLYHQFPYYEIAITGKKAHQLRMELDRYFIPNAVLIGSTGPSDLPLLEHKFVPGESIIYVCVEKSCQLPVSKVSDALEQITWESR